MIQWAIIVCPGHTHFLFICFVFTKTSLLYMISLDGIGVLQKCTCINLSKQDTDGLSKILSLEKLKMFTFHSMLIVPKTVFNGGTVFSAHRHGGSTRMTYHARPNYLETV